MAVGYCRFHKRYMSKDEIKVKRCRCKANTKNKCKYFIECSKLKLRYRNCVRK